MDIIDNFSSLSTQSSTNDMEQNINTFIAHFNICFTCSKGKGKVLK